ncbi:grass carp reovirus (GCRV)-induced gene 2e [Salvelinus namaycush]|uniref:Grass carp reovirus (GCRV)-induced gene 2e n=1 Tax=Salvelinus namaycush TaxID=8040 RepID=A0A8U0Q1N0_SALNM|nr:grass carp reovirus (GCRV)-induced gene 2e [Salvelinus namaycush]
MAMWRGDYFTTSAGARRMSLSGPRNGRTYIMYHGTSWWAAQKIMAKGFCPSNRGMLGQGVYLSRDLEKASRYPLDLTEHQVVIKVKVNVGKVKKIDLQGHPLQKTWHDEGYDSAWVPPNCGMVKSGLEENCVWDPNRITVLHMIKSKTEPTLQSEDTGNGRVHQMYHGTFEKTICKILTKGFCPSNRGMLGQGVYLSRDLEKASRYSLDLTEHQKVVIKVKVNVGKEKKIGCKGHPLQKTWHDEGYDSAWVPPNCGMVKSGLEENCVWDPKRITVLDTFKSKTEPTLQNVGLSGPRNGRTYIMYHGTSWWAAQKIMAKGFCPSNRGMLGQGVYLSRDLEKASRYPLDLTEHQKVVIKVKVNVGKVKKIDLQGHPLQKTWHDEGYDSAWVPPNCGMVKSGLEENCVWDPNRITV